MIMLSIAIVAKQTSNLLTEGRHACEIVAVAPTEAAESAEWKDRTPQLKATFRDEQGFQFSAWYNLLGYERYADLNKKDQQSGKFISVGEEGYAVVKATKKRVTSPENTEKAMSILEGLAFNSGIGAGEEITEVDLVGRRVGIIIAPNNNGQNRVKGTFMLPEVKEAAAVKA